MVEKKSFTNQDVPSVTDTEYKHCNFSHTSVIWEGPECRGHRLFPGDDTPRTFIECNLINCEPPPGSTLIDCNTTLLEPEVLINESDDIIIDGEAISIGHYKRVVHGKWTSAGYDLLPTPREKLFDKEM